MTNCTRCYRDRGVAFSHRLREPVCWRCLHCSLSATELAEAKRIEHQRGLARVIRGAAERAAGRRQQPLRDRALLIEVADSAEDVITLIDEVRDLGVRLEIKR